MVNGPGSTTEAPAAASETAPPGAGRLGELSSGQKNLLQRIGEKMRGVKGIKI